MSDIEVLGIADVIAGIDAAVGLLELVVDTEIDLAGKACEHEAKIRARVSNIEDEEHVHMRDRIKHAHEHLESDVTSEAEYSVYNEFGTRFMSAQPFMFPAFDLTQRRLMDRLKKL